jgi:hypothetical protein
MAATRAATMAATGAATDAATMAATGDATDAATDAATIAATGDATRFNDLHHWYVFREDISWMTREMAECARKAWYMWQGGNQWSAYDSFLSFFDRVVGLDLKEYEAWRHWEALSLHSGPRIVHADFCMISDRPEVLQVDEQNRPHCEDGPFCMWRDGSALYSWHGVRVPAWIIERPEEITADKIDAETNAEVRRVMLERYGEDRYLRENGATLVHEDARGKLWRKDMGNDEPLVMVEVVNSTPEPDGTRRTYFLRVDPSVQTATEAVAWTFGMQADEYQPIMET